MDRRAVISAVIMALAASGAVRADMTPLSGRDAGPRQVTQACNLTTDSLCSSWTVANGLDQLSASLVTESQTG
jgi:hypothetical protein